MVKDKECIKILVTQMHEVLMKGLQKRKPKKLSGAQVKVRRSQKVHSDFLKQR
jgi:hypothetical protein